MCSMSMRIALLSLAMSLGDQSFAADGSLNEPAPVVFVCEHGSVKSLIAMVYFNRSVRERRLPYRAVARGTAPARPKGTAVRLPDHGCRGSLSPFGAPRPGILYVIDVRTNSLVQAIPGVPGITGVEYVPGLHKALRRSSISRCRRART
ncbi:MAG: protein tyrosine phosphatase [Gammaproteobacteria bacterium]|nr:protein tyrosine phosphatase [Gammaproteobacteria bacterium]